MTAIPNRDRRAERREATRQEILDAAWTLARRDGLTAVTLREVGELVGMRAPSLYSHFASKHAIYDGMYGQAWDELNATFEAIDTASNAPKAPRRALLVVAETFFDFAVADLARHQLMNQAAVPGFRPSAETYAQAVAAYSRMEHEMHAVGVHAQADLDVWTALVSGAVNQQLANDPGGARWRRQLPRLVDMFADEVGLPGPPLRRSR